MNNAEEIFIRGFKAEQVTVRARGAPQPQFVLLTLAQAKRHRQRCFALDPAHDLRDPFGGENVIFTGLHHDGSVSELFGLAGAVEDFFARHAVAGQIAIALPQSAIHALPYAVTRDFDQAAQMHGVSDALSADLVGPLVQLRKAGGSALAAVQRPGTGGGGAPLKIGFFAPESGFAAADGASAYDSAIANTFDRIAEAPEPAAAAAPDQASLPATLRINLPLAQPLRYGENPHQRAALYADGSGLGIAGAHQLQGKELSYNNLVDLDACWELAQEFEEPAVIITKHTNPCGAAIGVNLLEAYQKALACDPVSAYGGVIGINREVDIEAAEEIAKLFVEAIAAPAFSPAARERFARKKNLRLVEVHSAAARFVVKNVSGGLLLQDADTGHITAAELKVVTKRKPTAEEIASLIFAWRVCKHVKSNAILYAKDGQTLGVGAGQMSRVDSARFGAVKAVLPLKGCVAASDAFFPFADGLEEIAKVGATAVIQPGGSVRDPEVIAAADKLGVAMVFTGMRHFRH